MPSCNVYLVEYAQIPRAHQAIFLEVTWNGAGQLYHVRGSVVYGMVYESTFATRPEDHTDFAEKRLLGTIDAADIDAVGTICGSITPPPGQWSRSTNINPNLRDRDSQDWVEDAVKALKDAGILVSGYLSQGGL